MMVFEAPIYITNQKLLGMSKIVINKALLIILLNCFFKVLFNTFQGQKFFIIRWIKGGRKYPDVHAEEQMVHKYKE